MTAKEKARDLVDKFVYHVQSITDWGQLNNAKECALIAVDECIESTKQLIHHYTKGNNERYASIYLSMSLSVQYWQEVKNEINKIEL